MPGRYQREGDGTKEDFTGHVEDEATGLHYAGARYYSAAFGRCMAPDPILGEKGAKELLKDDSRLLTMTSYNYAFNNPVGLTDPTGMAPCCISDEDITTWEETFNNLAENLSNAKQDFQQGDYLSSAGNALWGAGEFALDAVSASDPIGIMQVGGIAQASVKGASAVDDLVRSGKSLDEAAQTLQKASKGGDELETVFRVYGGDSGAKGFSWTPRNPGNVSNFRDAAGLPSGGASGAKNTGRFVIKGKVKGSDVIKKRAADPLDGNSGGLMEYIIDPDNVKIERVSGANPEF